MKAKSGRLQLAFMSIAVFCMLASCTVYHNPPVRYGQNKVYRQGYDRSYYRFGNNAGYHRSYHHGGHYGGHHGGHH